MTANTPDPRPINRVLREILERHPASRRVSPEYPPDAYRAACAHRSGIEHVEVTQPRGEKYEFWRCIECRCEFRPTGERRD